MNKEYFCEIIEKVGLKGFNDTFVYFKKQRKQNKDCIETDYIIEDVMFNTKIFATYDYMKNCNELFRKRYIPIYSNNKFMICEDLK